MNFFVTFIFLIGTAWGLFCGFRMGRDWVYGKFVKVTGDNGETWYIRIDED